MNHQLFELPEQHHRRHGDKYSAMYAAAVNGIDCFSGPAVFGSEPHCCPAFIEFVRDLKPSPTILEIGFNAGTSSALMLSLGAKQVVSVELHDTEGVRTGERKIIQKYGNDSLRLIISDSAVALPLLVATGIQFDAAYVDGDHSPEATSRDLMLCEKLGIKTVLMDDWLPQFGNSIQAADACGWTVDKIVGNFAIVTK
jgi:hypothetical protein